jgi:large subunit ribosomal protein L21
MYAIVEIAGQQFKVEEGKKIFVHRLDNEGGEDIQFDNVLFIENEGKIIIGEPTIKDAVIDGKILDHLRGDKVIVFKKKRRKGYRVKNGHRQNFTQVEIISINEKGSPKKAAPKKETKAVTETIVSEEPVKEKKVATGKPEIKKAAAPAKKTEEKAATVKKPAAKKPAAKKPAVKKPAAKKPVVKKNPKGEEK